VGGWHAACEGGGETRKGSHCETRHSVLHPQRVGRRGRRICVDLPSWAPALPLPPATWAAPSPRRSIPPRARFNPSNLLPLPAFSKGWDGHETKFWQPKGFRYDQFLKSFIRDESGAAAAEYALILAIVGAGIAVAAGNLGTAISTAINNAQSKI